MGTAWPSRLCDGLSGIRPEETDAVVIAGMGGETIAQILEEAPWVRTRKVPLVLQPMSSLPELRRLREGGIPISWRSVWPGRGHPLCCDAGGGGEEPP